MSIPEDFQSQFDADGRFLGKNGELAVIFATRGGARFPGKLYFKDGLCIRAEMERGGDWGLPDESPLDGVRFFLSFSTDRLYGVVVDHGRVVPLDEPRVRSGSKRDFLENFRIARNLFVHGKVAADSPTIDTAAIERTLARAAIWLTSKSVSGFNAADFPELGASRQQELLSAVQSFLAVAREVPSDRPATAEQYGNAAVAFAKILTILEPYLPLPDEAKSVEAALRTVKFPAWVVNWDYELGSDADDVPAVWVYVFADDQTLPRTQLGRAASELTTSIRQAFQTARINRGSYVRLKTAVEHKVG
ncbi:MAG TPA: hypothetical protein VH682_19150 [Gemmataceae bacterium]|jgi:hypothetical protein